MKKIKSLRKTIKKIKEKTEWGNLKIIKRLIRASKYGINPKDYLKYNCYKKKRKDLEKLGETLQNKNQAIKETIKNTSLSKKEAMNLVKKAHNLGFTYQRYINVRAWEFTEDELEEAKESLDNLRKLQAYNYNYYINVIVERTGWTIEKVKEELAKARKKGYYVKGYIINNLYSLKDEEIKDIKNRKKSKEYLKKEKLKKQEKEERIEKIQKEKNWTLGRYRNELNKAKFNCGCSDEDFYLYKLYNKTKKEQQSYITLDTYWKMEIKYCDYEKNYIYFHDKTLFNEKFKEFIHRKWFKTDDITYEKFKENIKGLSTICYKPINQLQGK